MLLEGGLLFVDNGEGHIRLNLACPRTMLTAGMKRISQVLRTPALTGYNPFLFGSLSCQDVVRTRHNTLCREQKGTDEQVVNILSEAC